MALNTVSMDIKIFYDALCNFLKVDGIEGTHAIGEPSGRAYFDLNGIPSIGVGYTCSDMGMTRA
ncbi:hypothetical protein [Parachitinimonas caeni]|uniref:Uncharacterized protein n=1 Tax=Parachitinimonas caeni TaxID=3031301 RepID=A0ABT7E3A3_9NEIS|nr:hypothetical protein [Parachitinimonas caeni]MDK2126719.1 hypothetical protein [Parachitinimonas caeni]